jgi:hypothetical protein
MNDAVMRDRIDAVLLNLEVRSLEDRIAPVKCEKNPDAPECQVDTLYGIAPEYCIDCGTPP